LSYPASTLFRVTTQHATQLTEILGLKDALAFSVPSAFVCEPASVVGNFEVVPIGGISRM
jgi:hypothetical protein